MHLIPAFHKVQWGWGCSRCVWASRSKRCWENGAAWKKWPLDAHSQMASQPSYCKETLGNLSAWTRKHSSRTWSVLKFLTLQSISKDMRFPIQWWVWTPRIDTRGEYVVNVKGVSKSWGTIVGNTAMRKRRRFPHMEASIVSQRVEFLSHAI